MVPWWTLIIVLFLGGWGGYALGAKVQAAAEADFMKVRGYVKRGEDWIKSEAGKLRNAL